MTYVVVALLRRKEGLSPSQFRTYYDTVHLPLLKSLVGSTAPLIHTRHYVSHEAATALGSSESIATLGSMAASGKEFHPTIMYQGSPSDVSFDSLTVMTWADKESWESFLKIFQSKVVAEKIDEDEENFLDRARKVVFSVATSTTTMRE
ncbi:hypothetical protein F4821DRAFT_159952 [Hypoxylon rubiginosum]|uniref:Uncharacterized protein n=1 Tax=Hypoxylon rubiginosum TaxID=110542 RepID=A0ACC0DI97_9PEZI|nr:hypothetical protein F4821DRAFT_159952 [Hypoxylon rubiginosum]